MTSPHTSSILNSSSTSSNDDGGGGGGGGGSGVPSSSSSSNITLVTNLSNGTWPTIHSEVKKINISLNDKRLSPKKINFFYIYKCTHINFACILTLNKALHLENKLSLRWHVCVPRSQHRKLLPIIYWLWQQAVIFFLLGRLRLRVCRPNRSKVRVSNLLALSSGSRADHLWTPLL